MGVAYKVRRHAFAVGGVGASVLALASVFAFARPEYRPPGTVTVDMAGQRHFSVAQVRHAFARRRITLVRRSTLRGTVFFGRASPPRVDGFTVTVYDPRATVTFRSSHDSTVYERRVGNVDVFYGGDDRAFAARVEAAVEALRHLTA